MEENARVVVHCCNRLLRELITRVLIKKTSFSVVARDGQPERVSEDLQDTSAEVVVLDSLESFLECAKSRSRFDQLSSKPPKCILVAMRDDQESFLSAVRSGACGYVLQDASATDVVAAVRAVADGQAACPPQYLRVLFNQVAAGAGERFSSCDQVQWRLTRRERELIPWIGRGMTNKEIAAQLRLSERTVKNHINRILKKSGASNRLGLFEMWQSSSPSQKSAGSQQS